VETLVIKKVLRRDLISEELNQEFRELNSGQVKANARFVVEQLAAPREAARKEKSAAVGRRMIRAKKETGDDNRLPPMSLMLGTRGGGDVAAQNKEVENVKAIRDRREKKTLNIPRA